MYSYRIVTPLIIGEMAKDMAGQENKALDPALSRTSTIVKGYFCQDLPGLGDTHGKRKRAIEHSAEGIAKKRILYVEDCEDISDVITQFLTLEGYCVSFTDSITKAVELAAIEGFDLYLVGDCFPLGSNLELIRRIKARDLTTPVILYSTQVYESYIERGKKAGAHVFIGKLAEIDYLLDNVRRLLGGSGHAPLFPGAKSEESP
jgi:CheY-like chemotaxis protein